MISDMYSEKKRNEWSFLYVVYKVVKIIYKY